MSLNLVSNYAASIATRYASTTDRNLSSSITKLTSGSRVVRASDDAAALAISNNFRREVAALQSVQTNVSQGMAMLQMADGAHQSVTDICIRMKQLAVMASSEHLNGRDRVSLDIEFQELKAEVDRIAQSTRFSGNILTGGPGGGAPTKTFTLDAAHDPYFAKITVYDPHLSTNDPTKLKLSATAAGASGQFVTLTDVERNITQTLKVESSMALDFTALGITVQPQASFPAAAFAQTAMKSAVLGTTDGGLLAIDPGPDLPFIKEIYTYDDGRISDKAENVKFTIEGDATSGYKLRASSVDPTQTEAHALTLGADGETFGSETFDFRSLGIRVTTTAAFSTDDVLDNARSFVVAGVKTFAAAGADAGLAVSYGGSPLTGAGNFSVKFVATGNANEFKAELYNGATKIATSAAKTLAANNVITNGTTKTFDTFTVVAGQEVTFAQFPSGFGVSLAAIGNQTLTANDKVEFQLEKNITTDLAGGQRVAATSRHNNLVSYFFQVGSGQSVSDRIQVDITSLTTRALGLAFLSLSDSVVSGVIGFTGMDNAQQANSVIERSIERLSTNRAKLGAKMNRINFVSDALSIAIENNEQARSSIIDLDIASEMSKFVSLQVLKEAGVAMISQAQKMPQSLLSLYQKL
jgi:flagellin-like hook-associated protein FlgL